MPARKERSNDTRMGNLLTASQSDSVTAHGISNNIERFMKIMYMLLKEDGKMICSDFHPFTKIVDSLGIQQKTMNYFSQNTYEGEMAHARFFPDEIRTQMPLCSYRKYTISEIINAVVHNGFVIKQFDEHPSWDNQYLPGEFTLIALKQP